MMYSRRPQTSRKVSMLEQLGFHESSEELVKYKESSDAPCMPYFGTTVVYCSPLTVVTVFGEA